MSLGILGIGLSAGIVTAVILNFAYFKLRHRPALQLYILVGTIFAALVPQVFFGTADMGASQATWYWQTDFDDTSSYILGWMMTVCLGFLPFAILSRRKSKG